MRKFKTGATRDTIEGKLQFIKFLSPVVLLRYCQYMEQHRKQTDGTLREPDNWKAGLPKGECIDSLVRHTHDLWLIHEGYPDKAREPIEDALCAIIFNATCVLHEVLLGRDVG